MNENRSKRRFANRFKKRNCKSYFVIPNEVIEKYQMREISAIDVAVFAVLCSLRRDYDGIQVSQKHIAFMCSISEKTVSASVYRLYLCGLIQNVITETVKQKKKYKTSVYCLKPLPDSGFFFVPRHIFFHTRITPKMFTLYFFMCRARDVEYDKSWNSYNDICEKLGFGKNQRSEVVALIGELVSCGLIRKTVRRIKKVFVDNIYRITGFETTTKSQNEKRSVCNEYGAKFIHLTNEKTILSTIIIPQPKKKVNPLYIQNRLDF